MGKTFDSKIEALEQEKSELDLSFLQSKKQELELRLSEILEGKINEGDEKNALNEARECHAKIREIKYKIQNIPGVQGDIDKKISFYQGEKEKAKDIQLYKDTTEGISEALGTDPVYQYAKKTNNTELIDKLRKRSLTPKEYFKILEKNITQEEYLTILREHNPELYYEGDPEGYYNRLFTQLQNKKVEIPLPEGMSERIKQEIKDFEEFKCLSADDIEIFLKKELRKNGGEIKDKHIRNKFKNLEEYKVAYKFLSLACKEYPQFKIIKDTIKNTTTETSNEGKNNRLLKDAIQSGSLTFEGRGANNEKTIKLRKIGKIENLEEKCQEYINLLEELGCKFCDRKSFLQELMKAITTQTHIKLDIGIEILLLKMIQTNLDPEESKKHGYFSYKLSNGYDARRIVAYPNGEIFTICPHSDYETHINNKPPLGKRKRHK